MLRKYNHYRDHSDNLKLGGLTAFSAGMVNVISVIVFFAFTSNVTGHYAILAQELAKGNWYQAAVVCLWITAFFTGNFVSGFLVIQGNSRLGTYLAHGVPVALEIACLLGTGIYMEYHYLETLKETEMLVMTLLFAMGLQNGLTAAITNFGVKTTHLTGLTTDLGILFAMFTRKEFRSNSVLVRRMQLLLLIMVAYMAGGVSAGTLYYSMGNSAFYMVCGVLMIVLFYDYYKIKVIWFLTRRQPFIRNVILESFNESRPSPKTELIRLRKRREVVK